MKFAPASLSARITVLLLVTSLSVLGAGSLLMDWRIDKELQQRFEQGLLAQAQALIAPIELQPKADRVEPDEGAWLTSGVLGVGGRVYYDIRCGGRIVAVSEPAPPLIPAGWPHSPTSAPQFGQSKVARKQLGWVMVDFQAPLGEQWGGTPSQREQAWRRAASPLEARDCSILLLQNRRPLEQILLAVDWILLLSPALALAIALIAVPIIVRRGLRPLGALGERMHRIGPQMPGQRLPAAGIHELDPLVDRFNGVLARMDEGLARERQFASGVAHETRTRLAELRALTEVERRYPSGRPATDILAEVGQIGAELENTVATLLQLTQLQSGLQAPRRQQLLVKPWAEHLLERQHAVATERGIELLLQVPAPLRLETDPGLLELVLNNLLGNACAYAPPGDTVKLSCDAKGLTVDNAAPALEANDLEHLGQRFWRKQKPDPGHAGLGLALAEAAAAALGGRLDYWLDPEQRLHARLTLGLAAG